MKFTNLLTVLIVAVLGFSTAIAGEKFVISGRIIDQDNGEILRGATVQLVKLKKGAKTDMKGSFRIKDVESGSYELKISYVGYKEKEIKEINVVNQNVSLGDIVLERHQAVVEHDTVDENNGQQAEEDHVAGGHSGFPCYDLVVGGVWLGQVILE